MRAAFFRQHGGPVVMEVAELPDPVLGAGQVLVQIKAAALNRVDKWVRDGWPGLKLQLPHVPGSDGAGVVAAAGPGATRFKPGDRVVLNTSLGCGECEVCLSGHDNWCPRW